MGDEEGGGITALQMLEAELKSLRITLDGVKKGEKTSVASERVVQSIVGAEGKDFFLVKEGAPDFNMYHTSAGGGGGDGECCIVL